MNSKNLKNSVWSIIDVLLYPTIYILFTPYFVQHLGVETYGIWMLINTLIVLMQIFNFGLGVNTQRSVAIALGNKNVSLVPKIVSTNLTTTLVISLICVILAVGFALMQNQFNTFHISKAKATVVVFSICLSGIIVALKFIEQIFTNTLVAFERIVLVSVYSSILRIIMLVVVLLLIYRGNSIVFIFVSNIIVLLVGLGLLHFFVSQSIGKFSVNFSFDRQVIFKEFETGKWIWFQSILVVLVFQCNKLLVAHWFGVTQFSYYSIVSTIFNYIHLAIMALTPWALPQLTKLYARNENTNEYYYSMRSFIHSISYIGILFFSLVYKLIFTIWMGENMMSQISSYLRFFMVFELIFVFTISPFYLLNAIGKGKVATLNTFIYSILSIIGMSIGYFISPNIDSLILGLIISFFISMIIQQTMIAIFQGFNLFSETVGIMIPTVSLSLFILLDYQNPILSVVIGAISLMSFAYIYFIKFPIHGHLWRFNLNLK
ncbi:MAG: hypothetical protein V4561_04465 [Bacteroidota bacterium]